MPDRSLLEHGEYLLELSCHFGLSRIHSPKVPKDQVRRCQCAELKSHLAVMDGSQHDPPLPKPGHHLVRTCHRVRTLLIFAFDATNFSRRSPDLHSALRPGSFFFPRFGLTEFSQSSRSRMILPHRQTRVRTESNTTRTPRAPSDQCQDCADPIVLCCCCRVTRAG